MEWRRFVTYLWNDPRILEEVRMMIFFIILYIIYIVLGIMLLDLIVLESKWNYLYSTKDECKLGCKIVKLVSTLYIAAILMIEDKKGTCLGFRYK